MSAIDDYINWRGLKGKDPEREAARAELAALRRELADARLIARYLFTRSAMDFWILVRLDRWTDEQVQAMHKDGLPILTDAAREALEKELG